MTAFWMTTRHVVDASDRFSDFGLVDEHADSTIPVVDGQADVSEDAEITLVDLLGLNVSVFGAESGYIQSIGNSELRSATPRNDNTAPALGDQDEELSGYVMSQESDDDKDYVALRHWLPSAWRLWL